MKTRGVRRQPAVFLGLWTALGILALPKARAQEPPPRAAGFHHVHLNVVDPDRSAEFYTTAFAKTRSTRVAGWDAVQAENVFLLFNEVDEPAPAEWTTALWHFGWNSADVVADYPDQTPERPPAASRGHLLDHIALTYPDVPAAVARLAAQGVTVLEGVHRFGNTARRAAFIEGPDAIAIELVEP